MTRHGGPRKTPRPRPLPRAVILALAALWLPGIPARAALIESIQSTIVPANSTNDSFDVTLTNTGPSSVTVGSFSFGIQADTSNITFNNVTTATTPATYIFNGTSLFGPDITVSTSTGPPPSISASDITTIPAGVVVASGSTVGLGHVFFNAGPATGITGLTFQPANTNLTDPSLANIPITTLTSGTVTVTPSVPEPSSLVIAGIVAGGLLVVHRRRRASA